MATDLVSTIDADRGEAVSSRLRINYVRLCSLPKNIYSKHLTAKPE